MLESRYEKADARGKKALRAVKLPGQKRHADRSESASDIARRLAIAKREARLSATSVFVLRDRVHLVTDGAAYDADNQMLALVQKVALVPHLGLAVAVRGHTETARWISAFVMNLPDTDRLEEVLEAGLHDQFANAVAADPARHFDALVAGMRNGKPFAILVSSHDRPEHKPFEALAIPAVWSSPPVAPEAMGSVLKAIWNSPLRAARMLLEAQREDGDCPVGGYGQITTISAAGIETKCVHQWSEDVNRQIRNPRRTR